MNQFQDNTLSDKTFSSSKTIVKKLKHHKKKISKNIIKNRF